MRDGRLYLVAPGGLDAGVLGAVIEAGVDVVQLRMKEALADEILLEAERYREVCSERDVPFVVNDRPDIALAAHADGVHLGQEDVPPTVARDILGPRAIIGRSTHSTADIDRGIDEHGRGVCDYIAVGPVFATPTAPHRAAVGLGLLRYAAERVRFPWFAIGGIDPANVADVVVAGGTRIVVVRAITLADDPAAAAKELRAALP